MTIKIEFAGDQPEKREVKTYTGSVKDWPEGVYQSGGELAIKFYGGDAEVMYISDGTASKCKTLGYVYTRVSDNSTILAITFAGTMNYPDGKPDGVDEPDPIEAACEEIRRVCDEQFAKSQLSDPTDLKVGDWIQGDFSKKYFKVSEVWEGGFKTDNEYVWEMDGDGYTVVPAPKGQQ